MAADGLSYISLLIFSMRQIPAAMKANRFCLNLILSSFQVS
ncbi:hypothetical protein SPLC1_S207790 [Arthrospira platensis C1]|nr:hypothetical protein SPLC1_S207790 [Arthrospira platensis C1]